MLFPYAILVYLSIVILPIFPLAVTSNWIEAEFFPTVPRDLRGNNIPIDRRAQALRPYSNGFCPQCRGELRSPKRYIIKAQVPNPDKNGVSGEKAHSLGFL